MNLDLNRIADALERYATGLRTDDDRALRLADRIEQCRREIAETDESSRLRLGLAQLFIADLRLTAERYGPTLLVVLLLEAHDSGEPGRSVPLSAFEALLEALSAFSTVERSSLGSPAARRLRASITQSELQHAQMYWMRDNADERRLAEAPKTAVRRIAETISSLYAPTMREAPQPQGRSASPHQPTQPAPPGRDSSLSSLGLSQRELEVAQLVAAGCTNRQIAARLSVSASTVDTYLSRIFTKLKISHRDALTGVLQNSKSS